MSKLSMEEIVVAKLIDAAAKERKLYLMECTDKKTGKPRAVLVVRDTEYDGEAYLPLGHLVVPDDMDNAYNLPEGFRQEEVEDFDD